MNAIVMSFANCSEKEAEDAIQAHNGDVYAAIDALLKLPVVSGAKYIPKPRAIDRGMTAEQEERCATGRALMDTLSAVSSAAQTKIRSGQSVAEGIEPSSARLPVEEPSAHSGLQSGQGSLSETAQLK